jgi:hypothetical protein
VTGDEETRLVEFAERLADRLDELDKINDVFLGTRQQRTDCMRRCGMFPYFARTHVRLSILLTGKSPFERRRAKLGVSPCSSSSLRTDQPGNPG